MHRRTIEALQRAGWERHSWLSPEGAEMPHICLTRRMGSHLAVKMWTIKGDGDDQICLMVDEMLKETQASFAKAWDNGRGIQPLCDATRVEGLYTQERAIDLPSGTLKMQIVHHEPGGYTTPDDSSAFLPGVSASSLVH